MPVVFKHDIRGGWIALWQITESEEELRALVLARDVASCAGMKSDKRRRERLAWRAMLRELLPETGEVRYDAAGALQIDRGHIGVSHCEGWAALIFRQQAKCAIDIEPADRDVSGVAVRMALPEATIEAWCAREARHKYGAQAAPDFLYREGLCIAYI